MVTSSRSDYGIYKPILNKFKQYKELDVRILATGMHLSTEFGHTIDQIKNDGFEVDDEIEMLLSSDTPEAIATSIGLGVIGFARSYHHYRPEMILVLGDRFEMYAAALAALPFNIPVAHIHGGEITKGAIDDPLRFSLTKLSHLHFVSTETYKNRVIQLGEEPWRVILSGAPSLDNLNDIKLLSKEELGLKYKIDLSQKPVLVTYHPVTKQINKTEYYIDELIKSLKLINDPIIITTPNADTSGRIMINKINDFVKTTKNAWIIDNLGTQDYFSFMAQSAVMIGNSSSGIIEAPSFKLPVVNIGIRQEGRVRAVNVIDVETDSKSIFDGYQLAMSKEFQDITKKCINPYHNGNASEIILDHLNKIKIDEKLIIKNFYDLNTKLSEE